MSHYEQLLDLLHAEQQRRDRRRTASGALRDLAAQPPLSKALSSFAREMTKLTPRSAKPAPKPSPRQALGQFMAKSLAAFQSGQITGEQLSLIEARRHHLVNTLASRGAL